MEISNRAYLTVVNPQFTKETGHPGGWYTYSGDSSLIEQLQRDPRQQTAALT
jgi:hypothetical protein